ncbi:hypothetical protein BJV82DRAFT_664137 [Fennellomyces sp. T-0311]|nr:hypothetical protein BJV82DRAFT_664137 [Fennellomyces sp. T-0311]
MAADDAPPIYEGVVQQRQDEHYYTPGGVVEYIERNLAIDGQCREHSLVQFQEPSTDDEKENAPPETRSRFLCVNCHTAITIQSNPINLRDGCSAPGYTTHHFHRTDNTFECCGCQYTVELSTEPPVIPLTALQKLTEERPIYRSSVATVRGERGPTVVEALVVLLTYVRGLLLGTRKNINARNENFQSRLGLDPASKMILQSVGFTFDDEKLQFICPTEGPALDHQRLFHCYGQLMALCYEIRQEVPSTGINEQFRNTVDSVWEARLAARTATGASNFLEPVSAQPLKEAVIDAYRVLGTVPGAMDDLVVWLYRKMVEENPNSAGTAMDCLVSVAESRNSETLVTEVAMERSQGRLGDKEVKDAYSHFGFTEPDKVDDGLLAGVYEVKLADEPNHQAEHKLKMSTIAEARGSKALLDLVLNTGKDPVNETPVGLNNIGNTCYLNSLLQYYFTLTPFRDTILYMDEYVENEDDPDWKPKKIGGIQVDQDEVRRAKKFVYLLRDLFKNLERASERAISPEYDLAYMALLNGRIDDAAKTEPPKEEPAKEGPLKEGSVKEEGEPLSVAAETPLVAASGEGSSRDVEGVLKTEEEATEGPSETTEMDSELETPPSKMERTSPNPFKPHPALTTQVAEPRNEYEDVDEVIKIDLDVPVDEAPPAYEDVVMEEAPSRADEKKPMAQDKPPALPPRDPRPSAANMMFGKQQDVTECMGNVMYLVEAALKPLETKENGEQIKDIVRDLFYGKARQILKYEDTTTAKQVTKVQEEDFMHVIVDAAEGKDLYDGLDEYFFADRVENFHGGRGATREVAVIDFPPILQIQVQRVQFDRTTVNVYKSNAFVQFDKMIYLDRYCECNFDKLADRRIQVSAWRKELDVHKQTIHKLTDTKTYPMPVPALLEATASILEEYQKDKEDGVAKYTQVLDFLREHEREARETIAHCEANIHELQRKIRTQYSDLDSFAYRIHAVFIHQGQANYGHYWIYIYNHQQEQWWKYNDSRVTKVDEAEIFQNTTGSTANPYFLVYIKDSEADALVQTIREEPVDETPL